MIKYAVFIEPEGELREFILSYKKKISSILPHQHYCNHPPHSTLFMSAMQEPENWLESLKSAVRRIFAFESHIRDTIVFYDDVLAGGRHTIALQVEPSAALFLLQRVVGEELASFVDRETIDMPSSFLENEPFLSSYLRYGFPFVGEHWIPHFTIASLQTSKNDPLITEFLNLCPKFNFLVKSVSIWRIDGDDHTQIGIIKLGK